MTMLEMRLVLLFVLAITFTGCRNPEPRKSDTHSLIDFSDTVRIVESKAGGNDFAGELRIAVASITSPRETFRYYQDMFRYISEKTGMKVSMIQRKTYGEINDLAATNQIDLAFVCSGGYISGMADSAFRLLVVPVRNGKTTYQSYIITHVSSGIDSFVDLRGRSFAFTDPLSTAGKLYPDKWLRDAGYSTEDFFSRTVYTYAHDNSIQLVSKRMVDGAAVNSLVYEYVVQNNPERVRNINIIERSGWFAMPPVVVSWALPDSMVTRLEELFLEMHLDEPSRNVLEKLMVDRYVTANDGDFQSVRDLLRTEREN